MKNQDNATSATGRTGMLKMVIIYANNGVSHSPELL